MGVRKSATVCQFVWHAASLVQDVARGPAQRGESKDVPGIGRMPAAKCRDLKKSWTM